MTHDDNDIELFEMLEAAVSEQCPSEAPWLIADPDFVRMTLEANWADTLTPEAIADATAWITHQAAA